MFDLLLLLLVAGIEPRGGEALREWEHGPFDKLIPKRLAAAAEADGAKVSGGRGVSIGAPNTLSEAERKEGWRLLFDGKTFDGWHVYNGAGFSGKGWKIEGGCLKNTKNTGRPGSGDGDLLTNEKFNDFDFQFDWRISAGGNGGVKYFVKERSDAQGAKMYAGDDGRSAVGLEYQLLDDERHPDGKNGPIRQTGSLYSLIPPNGAKRLNPPGEFNHSRIVARGNHVEHWLNGEKIVEYDLSSKGLMDVIAKSKYKDVPGLGTKFPTAILLQDHGDEVWFRNLKVRVLGGD